MMLRTILKLLAVDNRIKVQHSVKRHFSIRQVAGKFLNIIVPRVTVPYSHVCQIGDPVLRHETQAVEPEIITSAPFQAVMKHMIDVMRTYKAMGLSANQIGLAYKIFLIEVTTKHLEDFTEIDRKNRQIELSPLRVFINPKMKIIDYAEIKFDEECLSVLGYSAVVPRAKTVQIEALDLSGKPFVWKAEGWAARIAQHEMDHLQGKMYVERMDATTLSCTCWSKINAEKGCISIQFYPRSWLRRLF